MLAWRTTGANAVVRNNQVRTMVLRRVAAANPPLPPNSTRGLSPGLINPALGHVPGNVIPQPAMPGDRGRLRVGLGRARGAQGVPLLVPVPAAAPQPPAPPTLALANAAPLNPPQAHLPLNTQRRNDNARDNNKRRRSTRGSNIPPPEHQVRESSDSGEDNEMGSESDGGESSVVQIEVQSLFENTADSSKEVPLSHVRASRSQETAQSTTAKGKGKVIPAKRKASPKNNRAAKKVRHAEVGVNDDAEDSGVEDASRDSIIPESDDGFQNAFQASLHAPHSAREAPESLIQPQEARPARRPTRIESLRNSILQPGDPGFEEAFQESNRARRRRAAEAAQAAGGGTQEDRRAPNGPARSAPHDLSQRPPRPSSVHETPYLHRQAPSDTPSGLEPLGTEGRMPPTQAPRQNISAITGRPFAGPHRRPEALSPYGNNPVHHRSPAVGRPRAAPPLGLRVTQGNTARPTATRTDNTGRPSAPILPPRQGVYFRTPKGMHIYYPDESGIPAGQQQWEQSTTSTTFTHTQRRELELARRAQTNVHPPPPPSLPQPSRPPPPPPPPQQSQNIPAHSVSSLSIHPSVPNHSKPRNHLTDTDTPRQTPTPTPNPNHALTTTTTSAPAQQPNLPVETSQTNQLIEESTRHSEALIAEIHRRHLWPREELHRHARNVWEILNADNEEGEEDFATGFLEREAERERREHEERSGGSDEFYE